MIVTVKYVLYLLTSETCWTLCCIFYTVCWYKVIIRDSVVILKTVEGLWFGPVVPILIYKLGAGHGWDSVITN